MTFLGFIVLKFLLTFVTHYNFKSWYTFWILYVMLPVNFKNKKICGLSVLQNQVKLFSPPFAIPVIKYQSGKAIKVCGGWHGGTVDSDTTCNSTILYEISFSWCCLLLLVAIVVIWGVKQWKEALSSRTLCNLLSNIYTYTHIHT